MDYDPITGLAIFSILVNVVLALVIIHQSLRMRAQSDQIQDAANTISRSNYELAQAVRKNSSDSERRETK